MSISVRIVAAASAISAALATSVTQAAPCTDLCELPAPDSAALVVDATTQKLTGPREFPEDTALEVLLKNKNPFRYDYEIKVDTQRVELDVVQDAFAILGFPDVEKLLSDAETAAKAPIVSDAASTSGPQRTAAPGAAGPTSCDVLLAPYYSVIDAAYVKRDQALSDAKVAATPLASAKANYLSFQSQIEKATISTLSCPDLCSSGESAAAALQTLIAPNTLPTSISAIADLQNAVGALPTQADLALTAAQKTQCAVPLNVLKNQSSDFVKGSADAVKPYQQLVQELTTNKTAYQAARDDLRRVLSDSNSFRSFVSISATSEPVTHTLSLSIKDRLNPKAPTQSFSLGTITVGRSRLSFSVGPAVSFIDHTTYGRQTGLVPDGSGGTTVGSVVAITDESGEELAVVGQLNVRLMDLKRIRGGGFGVSFGASLTSGLSSSNFGLFLGPSISFRRELAFLTFGYHLQDTTRLGDTFSVGQTVPDDLTGDIPTTTERTGGLLVTFTIKAR